MPTLVQARARAERGGKSIALFPPSHTSVHHHMHCAQPSIHFNRHVCRHVCRHVSIPRWSFLNGLAIRGKHSQASPDRERGIVEVPAYVRARACACVCVCRCACACVRACVQRVQASPTRKNRVVEVWRSCGAMIRFLFRTHRRLYLGYI